MQIGEIRALAQDAKIRWTTHALHRIDERNILIEDVVRALLEGEIIEDYPTDYPYPSCLLLDCDRPIHVVCSIGAGTVVVITAYIPDPNEWHEDWKRRRST